jgi:hypothetical protein
MLGIFVDIENELVDIENEVKMLSRGVDVYRRTVVDADPAWNWLAIQGLASGVAKIYTGCERVMEMVANHVDGAKIEHSEGWHVSLVRQMAHPFPGIRDSVISPECFLALDHLRAFRHRERNSYGLVLDSEIVVERAAETKIAFAKFRSEIAAFAAKMDAGGWG